MIYVYQSYDHRFFRVVKGVHTQNEDWEKACIKREYLSTESALEVETDFPICEALLNIQVDEFFAVRLTKNNTAGGF